MRFGRSSHAADEIMGNNHLGTLGNEDDIQVIRHQESSPFQTIGLSSDRDLVGDLPEFAPGVRVGRINREPFLRFGRAVPYLRFGKRNFPYLRFGRNSPAEEAFSSFDNSRQPLHQLEDAVAILAGSPGIGEEAYGADRKKRSVETPVETAEDEVKGCLCGSDSRDSETTKASLGQVDKRQPRGNPYMRFGKKSDQENSDNNKYSWDRELDLYTKDRADKRKHEYMRFGRGKQGSTL
ncbi:hypothetical protein BsWGS_08048 [Bradybaena similaris]